MMEIRHVKYIVITAGFFLALSIIALFFSLFFYESVVLLIVIGLAYFFLRYSTGKGQPKIIFNIRKSLKQLYRNIRGRINLSPSKGRNTRRQVSYPHPHVHYGKNIKIERNIFSSLNKIRQRHNISTLTWDDTLYSDTQRRAKEIARNFSHSGCPSTCGENIAFLSLGTVRGRRFGRQDNIPQKFVTIWMKSDGHRENILRRNYRSSAIGVFQKGGKYYAVQLFS